MAQAVRCLSLTVEDRIRSQVSPCDSGGGQNGHGAGFSQSTSVFHFQQSLLHLQVALIRRTNGGRLGALDRKFFHFVFEELNKHTKDTNISYSITVW